MKSDVLKWVRGEHTGKIASKETLNHQGLIEMVTGLDVYTDTPEAYQRAYEALGIDIINRVPLGNAPMPVRPDEVRRDPVRPYSYAPLGVYDTALRISYPCSDPDEAWELDVGSAKYDDLVTPVPHSCHADDIIARQTAIGETGLYYPMLYTTLFMWGVEVLGWDVFLAAAAIEPERFHEHFIVPCAAKSKAIVTEMVQASESPLVFVHDDLATASGPVFSPSWYDEFIFPHYPEIWSEAKRLGRKVVFVADGNMTEFLPRLIEAGVDGLQFENPATPLEAVLEYFGDRLLIGGIETARLAFGRPEEVRQMVFHMAELTSTRLGLAISSCGGLHHGIPMANLEAYFDARAEIGATPPDWRTCCKK